MLFLRLYEAAFEHAYHFLCTPDVGQVRDKPNRHREFGRCPTFEAQPCNCVFCFEAQKLCVFVLPGGFLERNVAVFVIFSS